MLNQDVSAAAMLEAHDLHCLWAINEEYTLYCGPGTEREAAILKARYPRHRGAIEPGVYLRPGTMAIAKERMGFSGVLPPGILLGR